jgi:hypothetical protein
MNGRSLVACTLVGTIVLFAWQALSNTAFGWHQATWRSTTDTTASAVRTFRAEAPRNGVYINTHGLVAMVSATPDYADQSTQLGRMLGRQFAIDLFGVAMLCILAARLRDPSPAAVAAASGFGALAVVGVQELGTWNWYGFGIIWSMVNIVDCAIAFLITGWVIGWLARRMNGGAGVAVPAGAGYSASGATVST